MTTYARLVNSHALDCQVAADLADLATRFHPEWFSRNPFSVVPDGTLHGAVDNGNGTFSNPPAATPILVSRVLSWAELTNYLVTLLGGGSTGRGALGGVIKTCSSSASGGDNYFAAYLQSQGPFTKAEFVATLADVSTAVVSNAQKTTVANNWPQG